MSKGCKLNQGIDNYSLGLAFKLLGRYIRRQNWQEGLSYNWVPGEIAGSVAWASEWHLSHPEKPEHPPGWHRADSCCLILCPLLGPWEWRRDVFCDLHTCYFCTSSQFWFRIKALTLSGSWWMENSTQLGLPVHTPDSGPFLPTDLLPSFGLFLAETCPSAVDSG